MRVQAQVGPQGDDLRAQCYTLLHHLLYGGVAAYEEPLRAFLHGALRNRGGGSALRSAFGVSFEEVNASWRAWVKLEGAPRAGERNP